MKRLILITCTTVTFLLSFNAAAEKLEIGLAATPLIVRDKNYEAFSEHNLIQGRFGTDLRTQVGSAKGFQFALFLGYRFGKDSGTMYDDMVTDLMSHDINLGLRVRKAVIPWMSLFGDIYAGTLIGKMNAEIQGWMIDSYSYTSSHLGMQNTYTDTKATWAVGGRIGLEMHFSRQWLASRNVKRFCFGGEMAVGYAGYGDLEFDPSISGGDSNSIRIVSAGSWGGVNLSGASFQIAGSLYFF